MRIYVYHVCICAVAHRQTDRLGEYYASNSYDNQLKSRVINNNKNLYSSSISSLTVCPLRSRMRNHFFSSYYYFEQRRIKSNMRKMYTIFHEI